MADPAPPAPSEAALERLEVYVDVRGHDALDGSRMVIELLEHGAHELLATAGVGSDARELLLTLTGIKPHAARHACGSRGRANPRGGAARAGHEGAAPLGTA